VITQFSNTYNVHVRFSIALIVYIYFITLGDNFFAYNTIK